jgi:hypothetical protein
MAHNTQAPWEEIEFDKQPGFPSERGTDGSVAVKGVCPRCHAETRWTFAPGDGAQILALEPATVICACGYAHHDRPAASKETGCGAFWTIDVEL